MDDKVFKTIDEQIALLKKRGVQIDTPDDYHYAQNALSRIGYYNLINGYSKLFIDPSITDKVQYKPGTTIAEINALYQFDRMLRDILLRHILSFETHIKSLISYYFSEAHGHRDYLIYKNFDTNLRDSGKKITALIANIQRLISDRSNDPSIAHYLQKHGYIPLWVLNNILTMGVVSKLYSLMQQKERQSVAKEFGISDKDLQNILQYIANIRNFCAHGNRIYCYSTRTPLLDTKFHDMLLISKSPTGEFTLGKRDLFAVMIALKIVLSNNDYIRLSKEISRTIGNLEKRLNILKLQDIYNQMGFIPNWKQLEKLK